MENASRGSFSTGENGCALCSHCGWGDEMYMGLKYELKAWECSSMVDHVLSMCKGLASISRATKRKTKVLI